MYPSIHNDVLIPLELWAVSQSKRANPEGLFSMSLELYGEITAFSCRLFICYDMFKINSCLISVMLSKSI